MSRFRATALAVGLAAFAGCSSHSSPYSPVPVAGDQSTAQSPLSTVPSATESVVRAPESAAVVRYGNLKIVLNNLPSTIMANISVTGPNGWGMTVASAGTLVNVAPGPYLLTPQSVRYGAGTYSASPTMLAVNVMANSTATATLTYTYRAIATFSTQTMINIAQTLASNVARYGQDLRTGLTYCNVFVRDFVSSVIGSNPPELAGGVVNQLAAISTSSRWKEFTNRSDWNWTYAEAARQAQAGHIVIAVTTYQDAHIVAVMPYNLVAGWGSRVPVIAEATVRNRGACNVYGPNGLDSAAPLSCGFYAYQQPYIRFFVYTP